MKILLVTQRFRPLIGGAESVLSELARELARQNHTVTVLTARWEQSWAEQERVDDVEIVRIPLSQMRFWGTWRFMAALRRWLLDRGREFDIWYVSMLKHCAWVAVAASSHCNVPVVLRPEGSGPTGDIAWQQHALGGMRIRRRCERAAALVALSPHIRSELERAGMPSSRIHEIPNGVPIPPLGDEIDRMACRQRLGLKTSAPMAVFVGRISPEKGVEDLLAAWNRVETELPAAQLVIVGCGPQETELRARSAKHPNIIWVGASQEQDRYLRAADLFVLPSHEEGMSISLLEAMAASLPIVATDIPGNRSLIESGRHGLLVPPKRPDQLAKSMLLQLQAKSIAAAMGRAARDRVEEEFSITRMAKRHVELFQSLVKTV